MVSWLKAPMRQGLLLRLKELSKIYDQTQPA
jgi:hypothetical protein